MPPRGRGRPRGGTSRAPAAASTAESEPIPAVPGRTTRAAAATTAADPIVITDNASPDAPSGTVPPAPTAAETSQTNAAPTESAASSSRGSSRASKYKPKAIRRGEQERARLAEEVARSQALFNEQEARNQRASRGNARGRARGRGRGFLRILSRGSTAAGPLAAGMGFGGGAGASSQGGAYGETSSIDKSRINADTLYDAMDLSDEEDPAARFVVTKKKKPPMPMGIRRVEHEEDKVTMVSFGETEVQGQGASQPAEEDNSSDELFVSDGPAKREPGRVPDKDDEVWEHAVPKTRVKIKNEDGDKMDLDDIPEGGKFKTPDSPELKKKVIPADDESDTAPKKRKGDTEEELLADNLERMVHLFSVGMQDSERKDNAGAQAESALEGHMFLFQLPTILPPLKSTLPEAPKHVVKPEPIDDDESDDAVMFAPQKKPAVKINLTEVDSVKAEEGEDGDENEETGAGGYPNGGFLGKLVVRKSGKAELSWGGFPMEMEPGIQPNFLSTAVVLEDGDVKPQPGDVSGTAIELGKIQGYFSVAPVWGDEEEWEVGSDDLAIPGL